MNELRKEKVRLATKETAETFERLELNEEEIEIVTRSMNTAIRVQRIKKEMEDAARSYIEEKQEKTVDKIAKHSPAIISGCAIAISIASILIQLLQ